MGKIGKMGKKRFYLFTGILMAIIAVILIAIISVIPVLTDSSTNNPKHSTSTQSKRITTTTKNTIVIVGDDEDEDDDSTTTSITSITSTTSSTTITTVIQSTQLTQVTQSTTISSTSSTTTATSTTSKPATSTTKKTSATTQPIIEKALDKTGYVSYTYLNVRKGPNTSYKKIGSLSKNTKVKIVAESGNWYKIEFKSSNSDYGWVSKTYISDKLVTATDTTNSNPISTKRVAYLTFDDGPSVNTEKILDILDKYNVKATFFVIYHSKMEDRYKAIVERGHTIALHAYSHDYEKVYASESAYFKDLAKIHDYVEKITGVDSHIIRFPGGSSNTVSNKYCKGLMKKLKPDVVEKGFIYHDWNVSSGDASGNNVKASKLIANIKKGTGKKSTINVLMHDTGKSKRTTVEALPEIIEYLRSQGFEFEALTMDSTVIKHG